ncbi:MAG TPA: NAD-dependent deacylase [Anaerolineales bacterium]|nr:NAD-dependent deacylase [Anaerolineales bacterium]
MSSLAAGHPVRHALGHAADLLRHAHHAVALTGAGISTPSGIPDFRSAGDGLWERYDPMAVASLTRFRYDPEGFYAFLQPLATRFLTAEPNPGHRALARLERAQRLIGVITQNIDQLHQRAGSQHVLEIHGNVRRATCIVCYHEVDAQPYLERFVECGTIPRCEACGGVLKPNLILFGEELPQAVFYRARAWCAAADVLLIAGSSLEVTPASLLPQVALDAGASLIIVNRAPTYIDERAEAVFRDDLVEILPDLAAEVLGG